MSYEIPAATTTTVKGLSTGAALSGHGAQACILGHPIYLAAIVGILLGASGYRALTRWREDAKTKADH